MPYDNLSRKEMIRLGYKIINPRATCKKCDARIEWWETTKGKKVPVDPSTNPNDPPADDPLVAVMHWKTCKPKATEPVQQSLWAGTPAQRTEAATKLAAACHARVVVVLQDGHMSYSHRRDLTGSDIAHELITAANKIRRELEAEHGGM